MNQIDSKRSMIRRLPEHRSSVRIHSSLDAEDHDRLTALANRENSSVSRIVKLSVIEFLDREAGRDTPATQTTKRASRRG